MIDKSFTLDLSIEALRRRDSTELRFIVPVLAALLVHIGVQFQEPSARLFVGSSAAVLAGTTYFIHDAWNVDFGRAASIGAQMYAIFVATIFTTMAVYRLLLHRTRHIPGPRLMALSKWFMVYPDLKGQRPYMFQRLHRQYGDVMRIGPREVSVIDPEAIQTIYGASGPGARCTRGPWYDFTVESTKMRSRNLQSLRTMPEHHARRKVWDAGFSMKAIKGYEANIIQNVNLTIEQMSKREKDGPVDIAQWCTWFGFDVMGELGFGRGFDMVKTGKTAKAIHLLESGVILIMATGNVPYIMSLFTMLPNPIRVFEDWICDTLRVRVNQGKTGVVEADVFSHLLGEQKSTGQDVGFPMLSADAGLLIVAGSDTSSNAMAVTIFNLLAHEGYYAKVQKEVESVFGDHLADDLERLSKECPLLNACINETLRLWPPVASGLQRTTPAEGLTLPNGTFIPGNTVVSTLTYAIHRDPRNFSRPDDFIPERWMEKPKKGQVFNQKAFVAFGYGPTGCIGKNVAYHEMRAMIARFVQTFDAKLAPECNADEFKSNIKDCFVMVKPPIPVILHTRTPSFAIT
jgi:cytochrome P450